MTQRPCDQRVPVSAPLTSHTHVRTRTGQPSTRGGGCSHTRAGHLSSERDLCSPPRVRWGGGLQILPPPLPPGNLLQSSCRPVSAGDSSAVTRGRKMTAGGCKLPRGELGLGSAESGQSVRGRWSDISQQVLRATSLQGTERPGSLGEGAGAGPPPIIFHPSSSILVPPLPSSSPAPGSSSPSPGSSSSPPPSSSWDVGGARAEEAGAAQWGRNHRHVSCGRRRIEGTPGGTSAETPGGARGGTRTEAAEGGGLSHVVPDGVGQDHHAALALPQLLGSLHGHGHHAARTATCREGRGRVRWTRRGKGRRCTRGDVPEGSGGRRWIWGAAAPPTAHCRPRSPLAPERPSCSKPHHGHTKILQRMGLLPGNVPLWA